MLIYLIGMPGSGKTTLGIGLAKKMDLTFVDMDKLIEAKENKTIPELFSTKGESYFREIERLVLHEVMHLKNCVIATGGGAACFYDNIERMNKSGKTIFIDVSAKELYRRMQLSGNVSKRPLLNGKENSELLKELEEKLNSRRNFYNQANKIIIGDRLQIEDLVTTIEN